MSTSTRASEDFEHIVEDLLATDGPIMAGPWLGEVGFEVLYWIPLLRWCTETWPELAERLVVVSRGGVGSWYTGVASRYLDLFDHYDQASYDARLRAHIGEVRSSGSTLKQLEPTDWEKDISEWVRAELQTEQLGQLHPGLVHRFRGMIAKKIGGEHAGAAFSRWTAPPLGPLKGILPSGYVAVRFYQSAVFRGPRAAEFSRDLVERLSQEAPIVLLNTEMLIDPDHPDFAFDAPALALSSHMSFRDNLAMQTIAISRARAYVGNYGGLSYLAPNFGVASFGVWSNQARIVSSHLDLASDQYNRADMGGYHVSHLRDVETKELAQRILKSRPVPRADQAPKGKDLRRSVKRFRTEFADGKASTLEVVEDDAPQIASLLYRGRVEQLVPVDQPLALVAQAPRSGGTLMMRLLDGHSQCHAIPHEISKRWPSNDELTAGPNAAWEALKDEKLAGFFSKGFTQSRADLSKTKRKYPFLLPPRFQEQIFLALARLLEQQTPRAMVDAYMTSYFNAWLDNQSLYSGDKKWITAFSPGLVRSATTMNRIESVYPDGRVISVIRDPEQWYQSARRWSEAWRDVDAAISAWENAARGVLERKALLKERMLIVSFDDLVNGTEAVMRAVAGFLGIAWEDSLLVPTFNRLPIKANSSFQTTSTGILRDPAKRASQDLGGLERRIIAKRGSDLFGRISALALAVEAVDVADEGHDARAATR